MDTKKASVSQAAEKETIFWPWLEGLDDVRKAHSWVMLDGTRFCLGRLEGCRFCQGAQ